MNVPIRFPADGISDGAVRIRMHREADVPAMVEACQDPSIPEFTRVPTPYTEADARGWIHTAKAGRGDGSRLSLVIAGLDDGLLGSIGVHHIEWEESRAEIGYWVAPWARGRGVATAGVRLISAYAFDELGFGRLAITSEPHNKASVRVAEAAGFRREGVLRGFLNQKGEQKDVVSLGLLPSDLGAR